MGDLKDKVKEICELKEKLICETMPFVNAGVFSDGIDGPGVGQAIDMIKDLADAEKNIYKACYYKTVVEAMEEEKERKELMREMGMSDDNQGRMGYDNWRYPSSGRFAPEGSGQYYGYPIDYHMDPTEMRYGYSSNSGSSNSGNRGGGNSNRGNSNSGNYGTGSNSNSGGRSNSNRYGYPMDPQHGMAYNSYDDARRYYHESQDPNAKREMSEYANEHLDEALHTTKDIWSDAKPEKKKEFKKHMMELLKTIPD